MSRHGADQEVDHVLTLLTRRAHRRHHALGEALAAFSLAAEAALAPQDEVPQLELTVVVGRLDTVVLYESPQRFAVRDDVGARALQSINVGRRAALEHTLDVALNRAHPESQLLSGQLAILEAVPVLEQQRGQRKQLATDVAGWAGALTERNVLAQQMRVAHLPKRHRPEAEDRRAI